MIKKNSNIRRPRNRRGRQVGSADARALANVLKPMVRGLRVATPYTAALPAAYSTHVKSFFTPRTVGKNTMIARGCDLVYRVPASISEGRSTSFVCIPSNPSYWVGTRIASLASTFSNYRPRNVTFHYVPQVSVVRDGTVVMGTLWNQGCKSASY